MGQLTYTTQQVQDKLDAIGTTPRPNLLDNAYFVGGGSQQGGGQLPINQRGSTSYTSGSQYTIDRWRLTSGTSISLTVNSDSISISGSVYLVQDIEGSFPPGTYTFSVNVKSYSGTCGIRIRNGSTDLATGTISTTGINSITVTANSGITTPRVIVTSASGASIALTASKLELGSTQTLAHWDEDAQEWVLNEVPNYEEELARCQRFCYVLHATNTYDIIPANGYTGTATSDPRFSINVPVTMRTRPSVTLNGTWNISAINGDTQYQQAISSISWTYAGETWVRIAAIVGTAFSSNMAIYGIRNGNTTTDSIVLSADL